MVSNGDSRNCDRRTPLNVCRPLERLSQGIHQPDCGVWPFVSMMIHLFPQVMKFCNYRWKERLPYQIILRNITVKSKGWD